MLKNNKSPGPDKIPFELLKNLSIEAINILHRIYNHIWLRNDFPDSWQQIEIIPIPKPNKLKTNPRNYRPIALSNTLCKLLEKIINKRLVWHLEKQQYLNKNQAGFRQDHSTMDQILVLVNEIQKSLRNKQQLAAIFFDIKSAYPTAWRRYILNELKSYGLNGNIVHFIKNFLANKRFKVRANGTLSDEKIQENGVPQGSILSVTLFLLCMNRINEYIKKPVQFLLYADDLVIFCKGVNSRNLERLLQDAIRELEKWADKTGFQFSQEKTKIINFTKQRKQPNPNVTLYNVPIEHTNEIKFLGMTIDKTLSWKPHINIVKTECSKRLNIMKILGSQTWGADKISLLKIYKTLILAKIDYGCIAYATASRTTLKLLDAVHHTAIRIATGAFRSSPSISILNEAGEPTLQERREKLTMMYITNLAAKPQHGTYSHIFLRPNNQNILKIDDKTDLQQYINTISQSNNILIPTIQSTTFHHTAPWLFGKISTNTDLSVYNKAEVKLVQSKFADLQRQLRDPQLYYTDASKTENSCVIAVVHNNEIKTYQLPTTSSVYEAEAVAILKALEMATHTTYSQIAVCTDSLSVIQSLNNSYARDTIIQKIQDQVHQMSKQDKEVHLIWVPAHIGIEGNERANTAARESTSHEETLHLQPNKKHIQQIIKSKLQMTRLTKWHNTTDNKLRTVKDDIQNWNSGSNRREQVIMTRLRIGHTRHTHEHLMARLDTNLCETCNKQLTVNHILTDCQLYTNLRTNYNLPQNLKDILRLDSTTTNRVLQFLEAANIGTKI